jgi:peptidoglycan/LPS O-acetylase OafA/YrhL
MITSTQQGDPGRWVAILFVAVCLPYVASALAQRSDKLDRTLGNLAYPVYLFHWVPVVMVGHINHFKNLTFQPVLEVLFAAIGSTLIYVVIDRPLDRRRRKFVESHVEAAREKATYLAIPAVENT